MTPKEEYEARKAERKMKAAKGTQWVQDEMETIDTMDRLATSFERIADALEAMNVTTNH